MIRFRPDWRASACAAIALLAASGCASAPAPEPEAAPAPVAAAPTEKVVKIDLTEGTNMSAALSPDGKTIIMSIQGTMWTLPADGGDAKRLTRPEMDAHEPVFSPDGTMVAFYAFTGDSFSIWTMSPDGSNQKQWTGDEGDGRYPSFTPDGKSILYSSDAMKGYSAWSIDLATGEKKQLTTASDTGYTMPLTPYFQAAGNVAYPIMSPDGSRIAFVVDGDVDTLFVRDAAPPHNMKAMFTGGTLGAPVWTADGQSLYITGVTRQQTFLASVPLAGESAVKIVEQGDIFPFRPQIKADGSLMVTADGKIKTFAATGGEGVVTPFKATVEFTRPTYKRRSYDFTETAPHKAIGIGDPILSPDGSTAIFAAVGDLWKADLKTGAVSMLTDDAFFDVSPNWSPDGKQIAFVSDRGGKGDIWTMELATGKMTQMTDLLAPPNQPTWSPDGKKIAYLGGALASIFLGSTVDVLDVKTKKSTRIAGEIFGPSSPSWSPSGKTIAIINRLPLNSRFREGMNAIYLMSADGKGTPKYVMPVENVSLGRRQWNRPAWNANGEFIYRIDGELWTDTLNDAGELGGKPVQITTSGENPAWSADGKKVIFLDGPVMKIWDKATGAVHASSAGATWRRAIPDTSYTIRAGKLFDGRGDVYRENVDIVVQQSTIKEIYAAGSKPVTGMLIDASGKVVMPSLIEAHTHQSTTLGTKLSDLWYKFGITSVRETGGDAYEIIERREAEASGKRAGPRVFAAGSLNEGARVSYGVSETVRTPEEAVQVMEIAGAMELDMTKSYVRQNYDTQKVFIAEAHKHGIAVSGHELYPAIANGVDQMEHTGATSRRGFSTKQSRTGKSYKDMVDMVADSGLIITPTLALGGRNWKSGDPASGSMQAVKAIYDKGGFVVAGTDSPFIESASSLHKELEILVASGLTTAQTLRMVTYDNARALNADNQLGSIEPGKIADILILDGDPLANIQDTLKVDTLMKNGVVVLEGGEIKR
jgi:Tol biopolymer transport system component/imidazolonepropionase-like amidohydrolase